MYGPILWVTLANFFFFLNFASYFLLPLFVKELGGREVDVGLVMGTTGFASLLSTTLVGQFMDRIGPRPFLLFGATTMTIAALLFLTVDHIGPWLFALRVLQGVSLACAFTATTSMAAQLAAPDQRARALGLFGLSTVLTHAIAPAAGEEIIHRFGFPTLFVITAGCTTIVIAIAATLKIGGKSTHASGNHGARELSRSHWIVGGATVLFGMGFGTVMTFVATYVQIEQFGRVGVFFGAYTSTAILTRFIGAGVSDRYGRRAVVVPALALLGVSIALIAVARSTLGLAFAGFVFGAAQGISYPTLHALVVDLSSDRQLGRAQALYNGSFNLGVTIGSFAFGPIAQTAGYRVMFGILATSPIVSALVLALALPTTSEAK